MIATLLTGHNVAFWAVLLIAGCFTLAHVIFGARRATFRHTMGKPHDRF